MKTILIIDDNDEFRTMVGYFFSDAGYHIEIAVNGQEGLDKARKIIPDIILLDVMMPDIGGIEVLRELQTNEETRKIPVIVITGTYFDQNMHTLFKQEPNCVDFVSKTTEPSMILKKLENLKSL